MMEGDDEKGRDNKNRGNEGDEEPEEAAEYEVQRVKSQWVGQCQQWRGVKWKDSQEKEALRQVDRTVERQQTAKGLVMKSHYTTNRWQNKKNECLQF